MLLPHQDPIQHVINSALAHHFYSDAVFLAERLYAEAANDSTLHLLATCYYRAGKKYQAYGLLTSERHISPQSKYLLGKCCFELNKLQEAEAILNGGSSKVKTSDDIYSTYGETAPFVLGLLADIYRKTGRHTKAAELYKDSLRLNPFLWSSFTMLCQAGEVVDPSTIFSDCNAHTLLQTFQQQTLGTVSNSFFTCTPAAVMSPASTHQPISTSYQQDHVPSQHAALGPLAAGDPSENSPANTSLNYVLPALSVCNPVTAMVLVTPEDAASRLKSSGEQYGAQKVRAVVSSSCRGVSSPLSAHGPSHSPVPGLSLIPLETPSPCLVDSAPFITPALGGALPDPLPPAPVKKVTGITKKGTGVGVSKLVFSQSISNSRHDVDLATPNPLPALTTGHLHNSLTVRRSSRIFAHQNSSSVKENNSKTHGHSKTSGSRPTSNRGRSARLDDELNELNKRVTADGKRACDTPQQQIELLQLQSAANLLKLLRHVGEGYLALQQFCCKKAVDAFSSIPPCQYKTGWVMSQLARAWFEMSDYRKAEEIFKEVRKIAPYQLGEMEMFSTALWHLQKDVALSALALELGGIDVHAPEVWCVRGNCFSLQKEHEAAIKFFQRAIQVDPEFSYAYTLLGHEYTLVEDFDKAMSCFRNAIRIDPRRYNAWYGVGLIYYKQEKFLLAEAHFKKALTINPHSPVLLCHIGVVQHALSKPDLALTTLNKALSVDPKNPLCKFHKATVLLAKDRLQEALQELEELRDIEPRESLVYFLMGKVHKKLGNSHLALLNFSWAMDLDPKGANNHIKEAIDKRYVNDDELMSSPGAAEADNDHEEGTDEAARAADIRGSQMETDEGAAQLEASESDESL